MARFPLKPLFLILALLATSPAFAAADNDPLTAEERISADDLLSLVETGADVAIFDARGKRDYDALHIDRAVLPLPLSFYNESELFNEGIVPKAPEIGPALAEAMAAYPKDAHIVTYCSRDCVASARLLRLLKRLGYGNVQAMEEGIEAWRDKGYPVAGTG